MLGRVLILGESSADFDLLARPLEAAGFQVTHRRTLEGALARIEEGEVDLLISSTEIAHGDAVLGSVAGSAPGSGLGVAGHSLPMTGFDLCHRIAISRPDVPCILLGDEESFRDAIAAIRAGAFDYFVRPLEVSAVEPSVRRALQHRALQDEVKRLRTALAEVTAFEEIIGVSPPMLQMYELLEQAAHSNASVLITGESGTGKELVARALHRRSRRSEGPFVAVNCTAIPEPLLESEMFGHVKGAFTDAKASRSGLFVRAHQGSLFLDEVGDLPMSLQPKFLRALQERKVRPVGGDLEQAFDVRLIAATNKNLEHAVAEKAFREDLFYRINVIHIEVPPLRERISDVVLLAQHYVEHYALINDKAVGGVSAAAQAKLSAYTWPGNVRELQNCIERAVALTRHSELHVDDLPEKVRKFKRDHVLVVSADPSELVPMEEVERRYILRVLQAVGGNKREAARLLGFDRKTLYRKLERFSMPS